jgi:hypothetical protein
LPGAGFSGPSELSQRLLPLLKPHRWGIVSSLGF